VLFCWTSLYCTLNFLQLQSLAIPLGCLYQFCSASMIHSQSSLFILKKYTYLVFNMSCQLRACYAVLFLCFFFLFCLCSFFSFSCFLMNLYNDFSFNVTVFYTQHAFELGRGHCVLLVSFRLCI